MKTQQIILTEDQESVTLAEYLELLQLTGKVKVFTHVPHETYTKHWGVKMRNKRMGVKSGMSDYIIVTDTYVIFIEMKRTKGGTVSPDQKIWIPALDGKVTKSYLCKGFNEAKARIDALL